jgi:hypothetical protein
MFFFIFLLFLSSRQIGGSVSGASVATGDFVDREIGEGDFVDRIGAGDFVDRCGELVGTVATGTGGTTGVDGITGADVAIGTTGGVAVGAGARVVLGDLVFAKGQIWREGSSNSV